MSLYGIFDIAGSGMSAQTVRLNTTASNLSNAESINGDPDKVYKARQPVFAAVQMDANNQMSDSKFGVEVTDIVKSDEPIRSEYRPGHPLANDEGFVYLSNVNSIAEMANMISASRSYQSNAQVLMTAKDLMMRTLQLGQ